MEDMAQHLDHGDSGSDQFKALAVKCLLLVLRPAHPIASCRRCARAGSRRAANNRTKDVQLRGLAARPLARD
eukprot:2599552-Pyramimonas_sp.AAC.1